VSKLKLVLYPISAVVGGVIRLRHWLYDKKIFRSKSFDFPLVKIGNLNLGGTGKTPHAEYVIRLLKVENKVALLSRGYGRKTKGYLLATKKSTPDEIGDEAYQLYSNVPKIKVAVDEKRPRGVQNLMKEGVEVIVLDDALQHRALASGLSILLMDFSRPVYEDYLWPAGKLRDIRSRVSIANLMIVSKCPDNLTKSEQLYITERLSLSSRQSIFFTAIEYGQLTPVFKHKKSLKEGEILDNVLLFSGIANSQTFVEKGASLATNFVFQEFSDHHDYSLSDMEKLNKIFDSFAHGSNLLVTTEKDAVKLRSLDLEEAHKKLPIFYLPIKVNFLNNEEHFEKLVKDYVRKNKRNR